MKLNRPLTNRTLKLMENDQNFIKSERNFARLLISDGNIVYREPHFTCTSRVPDFLVYNPKNGMIRVVEMTRTKKQESDSKKNGQIAALKEIKKCCNLEYTVLWGEDLDTIQKCTGVDLS